MFLQGLLFGIGCIVGIGIVVSAGIGILALLDWTGRFRSKGQRAHGQDKPGDLTRQELIAHAKYEIQRGERFLQLLQQMEWRGGTEEPETLRPFRIQ